jgi:SAM-dependent methyltransferase
LANHITVGAGPRDEFACRQAVEQNPKSGDARLELAYALQAIGDPAEAVEQCSKALELQPRLHDAARLLASLMQRYALNEDINISSRGLRAAFQFIDIDQQSLCNAAIAYLTFKPPLSDILAFGRAEGWRAAANDLLKGKGRKLLQDRLFRTALACGVNTDLEIEFLLTALRERLLTGPEILSSRQIYEFACILIQHCDNNGYVFFITETEQSLLDNLEFDVAAVLEGDTATVRSFILASLYKPLATLLDLSQSERNFDKVAPRALRQIIADGMEALRLETTAAAEIPNLTPITDETSLRVAEQYKRAPYPRWLSLQAPLPGSAKQQLQAYFSNSQIEILNGSPDVLIAGAGTCRQAVHSAIAYGPRANVLALDLSTPSLAYGARMASLLGADNIRFAAADILRLGTIDLQFDIIECGGVLHHMDDPYAAWRILLDKLRPGGIIQIGLYSSISRRVIESLVEDPDWPGAEATDNALRTYRHHLMQRSPDDTGFELTQSIDFFATGDFRDLALHVQEQRCSLPDIRNFLAENNLDFHGFVLPPAVLEAYGETYPTDATPGTLDHWWEFEQANPRTFDGMYMFWCRVSDKD